MGVGALDDVLPVNQRCLFISCFEEATWDKGSMALDSALFASRTFCGLRPSCAVVSSVLVPEASQVRTDQHSQGID